MILLGKGAPLTAPGFTSVCTQLGVGAAEVWALAFTEADYPYSGFWADRRPQILYEQHIFSRLTNGIYDKQAPDISNPKQGNYGASGDNQYIRLRKAMDLNVDAAVQSASWGIGQVLGENYEAVGASSPEDFVSKMLASEDQQLLAAANEILSHKTVSVSGFLATHDWPNFAYYYNGSNYAASGYDKHLSSWYAKFSTGALPDIRVRAAQIYLMYLGYNPNVIDGIWGPRTASAVSAFQKDMGDPVTGQIDDPTLQQLINANA
ncbi:N-acetylmuramidase domain-containing protein [Paraburkholderia fungorum]|uniref:N-acetylmuramidase domain-containing protein n=1 Tax=Paraburkholderia fungorum TaxID=134537 RepID=A0AAP5UTY3_9BURK|nr:N-acetylmuramidase domain-containing protein [Paraburkholderia fungorum]MDT8838316.1 N-acetylmuramidase domain-containing protein [Paraburkholderia fungorum]PRZ51845.1 putative peptidoglycan binding protein [Paraburkholderia fungorum]